MILSYCSWYVVSFAKNLLLFGPQSNTGWGLDGAYTPHLPFLAREGAVALVGPAEIMQLHLQTLPRMGCRGHSAVQSQTLCVSLLLLLPVAVWDFCWETKISLAKLRFSLTTTVSDGMHCQVLLQWCGRPLLFKKQNKNQLNKKKAHIPGSQLRRRHNTAPSAKAMALLFKSNQKNSHCGRIKEKGNRRSSSVHVPNARGYCWLSVDFKLPSLLQTHQTS